MSDVLASVLEWFLGAVPQRQPWRTVVTAAYLAGALIGIAVLVAAATGGL